MGIIDNKFRLEDLYISMEIKDKDQLSGIYDTWITSVYETVSVYIEKGLCKNSAIQVNYKKESYKGVRGKMV